MNINRKKAKELALKIKDGDEYNKKMAKLIQLGLDIDDEEVTEHFDKIIGENDLKFDKDICIEPIEI